MDKNTYQTDKIKLPRFVMQLVIVISRVLVQMTAVLVAEVVVPLPFFFFTVSLPARGSWIWALLIINQGKAWHGHRSLLC